MNSSEKNDSGISSELQENINLLRQLDFFSSLRLEALKVIAASEQDYWNHYGHLHDRARAKEG